MGHLVIDKLRAAETQTDPFEYTIVPAFPTAESIGRINATYPSITKGGSYPIEALAAGMAIKEVVNELDGRELEATVAEKFRLDLTGKPKCTHCGGCLRAKDGKIIRPTPFAALNRNASGKTCVDVSERRDLVCAAIPAPTAEDTDILGHSLLEIDYIAVLDPIGARLLDGCRDVEPRVGQGQVNRLSVAERNRIREGEEREQGPGSERWSVDSAPGEFSAANLTCADLAIRATLTDRAWWPNYERAHLGRNGTNEALSYLVALAVFTL